MGFQLLVLVLYPDGDRAAVQQVLAAARRPGARRASKRCSRAAASRRAACSSMDGSKRSGHGNAYFTGFGRARRIVFFDTLLERLRPTRSRRCSRTSSAISSCARDQARRCGRRCCRSLFSRCSPGSPRRRGSTRGSAYRRRGRGRDGAARRRARPVLARAAGVHVRAGAACRRSIRAGTSSRPTRSPRSTRRRPRSAQALVKLYEDNAATLTPDPLHSAFYDSHPPAAVRIARLERRSRAAPQPGCAAVGHDARDSLALLRRAASRRRAAAQTAARRSQPATPRRRSDARRARLRRAATRSASATTRSDLHAHRPPREVRRRS